MPNLELFLHDRHVGTVTPEGRDRTRVRLSVDRDYRQEIVLSEAFTVLPRHEPPTVSVTNFLGGYVPEGNHRDRMAAKRQIDKDDLFALLTEFGGSIAGAVTLGRGGEESQQQSSYEALDERSLATKLRQALRDSDQGIPDDSRSTLPGYQPKVLVARFDGQWMYPHGMAHSTYILKPQVPARPTRLFDEHYSHLLAGHLGLSSYRSDIHQAGRVKYLAIERFDRAVSGERVLLRHQEDLAQALSLDWRDSEVKFQQPEWPSDPRRATVRRIAEVLGTLPGAQAALESWIRQLVYNLAIGNNDAHAKNVALMHLASGTELSQIYDAVPNLFQDGLIGWNLALAIDGQFDHRRMSVERILAEISSWSVISSGRAEVIITDTLNSLEEALAATTPPKGISAGLPEHLQWNVRRLLAGTEISTPKMVTG